MPLVHYAWINFARGPRALWINFAHGLRTLLIKFARGPHALLDQFCAPGFGWTQMGQIPCRASVTKGKGKTMLHINAKEWAKHNSVEQ